MVQFVLKNDALKEMKLPKQKINAIKLIFIVSRFTSYA